MEEGLEQEEAEEDQDLEADQELVALEVIVEMVEDQVSVLQEVIVEV